MAVGDRHRRGPAEPPEQMREHLHRRRVGPMEVVEREHQRLAPGQPLEHAPDRIVEPVALGALAPARVAVGLARQRREDRSELARDVVVERAQDRRLERTEVVVERVDDQAERNVALELGRTAVENEIATLFATAAELREQPRFPDPRLADDLQAPRHAVSELIERSFGVQRARGHGTTTSARTC